MRFLRENLAEFLAREGELSVAGVFADSQEALIGIANNQLDLLLVDDALPGGRAAVRQIKGVAAQTLIVVIAVAETAQKVISWAEVGAAGYIPRTAGLAEIIPLLVEIVRDRQPCSAGVAAGLLRRLSNGGATNGRSHGSTFLPPLTAREAQIAQMLAAGMCDKDIARQLEIGLATAKTHVHHLLGKLNFQRRGQAANWVRQQRDHYPEGW